MKRFRLKDILLLLLLPLAAAAFAVFPLTDTDIWWHLACARDWVTTWTPVRDPVVNVHYFFQQMVALVYGAGGAQALVFFKSILWGIVFSLFLFPQFRSFKKQSLLGICAAVVLLFLFRYQLEMRPVVVSLLFLGVYWNVVPALFERDKLTARKVILGIFLLAIQWVWCKTQGLYILGPLFTAGVFFIEMLKVGEKREFWGLFPLLMFGMPFLHREGLSLFLYPLGLLERLLGLTPSAAIFASEIAENRSPVTLLLAGENTLASFGMVVLVMATLEYEISRLVVLRKRILLESSREIVLSATLLVTAVLALTAERNFVLLLPVFLSAITFPRSSFFRCSSFSFRPSMSFVVRSLFFVSLGLVLGFWLRSLKAYDGSMVSIQRVPVAATEWMKVHGHEGRLFNDDRAGGYLALMKPKDSTYMDGRFMLKTADFFKQYLDFAKNTRGFMSYADSLGIDRAILPLKYYARWGKLIHVLQNDDRWHLVYRDDYFCVFDKIAE